MTSGAPGNARIRAMLAEAPAQYRVRPGDYLEGVIVGLMRVLDMDPDRSWCDNNAQDRNAADRPPVQRVRDYLNGGKTAAAWAEGSSANPPILAVLQPPALQEGSDQ